VRRGPSGRTYNHGEMTETVEARGGSTPFNLLPVATGGTSADKNSHQSKTPYDVVAWWVKYLLPPGGVLLDSFAGSGTMLVAGLDFGASQVIGIEQQKKYLKMAERRILEG
jgi:DNA modification methylase